MDALDDILPLILQAYCKPTLPPRSQCRYYTGPVLLEQDWCIAQDAGLVIKKWRTFALVAQRKAVKAMREAFFAKVVEFVLCECQSAALGLHSKCVLRHAGVTTTVVGLTLHKTRLPPVCNVYLKHYPVDDTQQQVTCMHPSPDGPRLPPIGHNVRQDSYRLDEMPHYRVRDLKLVQQQAWLADFALDACRSEEQRKETQAWLADFAQQVLQDLLQNFALLNERDWHRQRFRQRA